MAAEEMGPATHFTLQTKSFAVIMIYPGQNFKIVVQEEEEPLLSSPPPLRLLPPRPSRGS